mgnify:CR=1 FL=1
MVRSTLVYAYIGLLYQQDVICPIIWVLIEIVLITKLVLDMVGCLAPGCANNSEKGFCLYPFPKDPNLRAWWVVMMKRAEPAQPHKPLQPTPYNKICPVCVCITRLCSMLVVSTDVDLCMAYMHACTLCLRCQGNWASFIAGKFWWQMLCGATIFIHQYLKVGAPDCENMVLLSFFITTVGRAIRNLNACASISSSSADQTYEHVQQGKVA